MTHLNPYHLATILTLSLWLAYGGMAYWRPKLQDAQLDRRIRAKCRRGAYDQEGARP